MAFWRRPHEARYGSEASFVLSTRSFLIAQCFLGIALQIAVLHSQPWNIDPVNGIGFVFVSLTGLLPPVFTLLLLHSQHAKSWLAYILVLMSWILASANFFILYSRFSTPARIQEISESALADMNHISACAGSSAFALCSTVTGRNPLSYAGGLYTYGGPDAFPSFKSIPFIWVCSTLMLVAATISQVWGIRKAAAIETKSSIQSRGGFFSQHSSGVYRWASHWTALLLAFLMFIFCTVYYQAGILYRLDSMDVLEWNGWTFGQVAAVTIWVPVVVEYLYNPFAERS